MRKKAAQWKEKVMHGNGDCGSEQMREKNGDRACKEMIGRQGTDRNVNQLQSAAYLLPVPKSKAG